jgi:hypothetical protein
VTATIGREIVNGLIKGIGDRISALFEKVKTLPGRIRAAIGERRDASCTATAATW